MTARGGVMYRWLFVLALLLSGCSWESRVKRLSDTEFDHYYALKPYMSDADRKTYLKLKTEDDRNAWLKQQGLWDRFYKYPENLRKAIVEGAVQVGWTKDMVVMAWGAPYDRRALAGRPAPRSELYVYKFEKQEDGTVLVYVPNSKTEYKAVERFVREVYLDSDVVAEIIEKKGWSQ
jgi:hypothetical protein